jgi:hypothetical protein
MKILHILSAIIVFIVGVMICTPAFSNPYQINNVKVDVEGESAIDAREKALQQARRSAFEVLTKRMVSSDARTAMPNIDDQTIAAMVDSFEINREKLSKNRYLASVNVTFNERAIQGYLGRHTTMAIPDTSTNLPSVQAQNTPVDDNMNAPYNPNATYQNQPPMIGSLNTYRIRVNLNGIYEWINIQNQLRAISGVKMLEVNALNASFAIMTLSYAGDGSRLQNDLNSRGMQIYSNTNPSMGYIPYILVKRG